MSFDRVTLRRSTGLTKWKSPGVIDGSSAERAEFVRCADVARELREIAAGYGPIKPDSSNPDAYAHEETCQDIYESLTDLAMAIEGGSSLHPDETATAEAGQSQIKEPSKPHD